MNSETLLKQLQHYQQCVLDRLKSSNIDYRKQYHEDLSPTGWHLGHCLYTEEYWVREKLHGREISNDNLKKLYIPENCKKTDRGNSLPEFGELYHWAETTQSKTRQLIEEFITSKNSHVLMDNNFLLKFLIQHYAQHFETIQVIHAQAALAKITSQTFSKSTTTKVSVDNKISTVKEGQYEIGAASDHDPYDNEHPRHKVQLNCFNIAFRPVTNNDYLQFMKNGGYETNSIWTEEGWLWRQKSNTPHPEYWRRDNNNEWYEIKADDCFRLSPDAAVSGINYFEAIAFAKWADARLPHEYEWEVADQLGLLGETGKVWEWCCNTFHPYKNFRAFPYDGYSLPYYDDKHYVLKGGSIYTSNIIRRSSFRNYYQPNKRHIIAGLRLVYN